MRDVGPVLAAIDAANGEDPNQHDGQPLALMQGQLASAWLERLSPHASPELQVAARGHHLKRWELARADYPEGRAGYLRWRAANKAHQADAAAEILAGDGWDAEAIERVQQLLRREGLRTDPETQLLEDAACLVFLETQYDDMIARLESDHMVSVVGKTLRKMSAEAIALAGTIGLSAEGQDVLARAVNEIGGS